MVFENWDKIATPEAQSLSQLEFFKSCSNFMIYRSSVRFVMVLNAFFNALLRGFFLNLRHWFRHYQVMLHNPNTLISFPIVFQYDDISAIKLGSNVVIGPFSEIVFESQSSFSSISGQLTLENHVVIGAHANIRATGGEILIKKNTLIGQHVSLIASNHKISTEKSYRELNWDEFRTGILIEENVWLGANVTVLPGCSIGQNSVVGAGSLVTKSIPANEIWVGVPARKLRNICPSETPATNVAIPTLRL
jgi:acetyltransferase-like isoleucine patch superfamily enzyme